jgi:hypothetical protein
MLVAAQSFGCDTRVSTAGRQAISTKRSNKNLGNKKML